MKEARNRKNLSFISEKSSPLEAIKISWLAHKGLFERKKTVATGLVR